LAGSGRHNRRRPIKPLPFSPGWPRFFFIALFIAIPLIYFIFLPVSYSFDGTVFSHMLRNALLKHDWLGIAQIHHLLYFPVSYLAYRLLEVLFHYRVLEFFHLQLFSMFFGVATLFLVERLLKRSGLDLPLRLAGVAMVAFSHAFWLFSVDAEVHVPGLFFIMAGMALLLFRSDKFPALAGAALCFAVAAGFHLTNGLIVLTVFFFLLARRAPWRNFVLFFGSYASAILFMFGAYSLLSGKPLLNIIRSAIAGNDSYSGYHIAYAQPFSWTTALASLLSVKKALLSGAGLPATLILAVVFLLLALGLSRPGTKTERRFKQAMLFWALPYLLFFSIWDPGNMEFKIHVAVPLLLLVAVFLSGWKPAAARTTGAILAIGLLGINLIYGIKPQSEISNNTDYQTAQAIRRATPDNAQVLLTGKFTGYGYGKIYIPYFAHREVLILDWLLGKGHVLPEILAELSRRVSSGCPLYTLEEIAVPGKSLFALLDFHEVSGKDRAFFSSAVLFVPVTALPGGHRLFRLEFKTP
jgi:hypothetical protein